MKFWIHGLLFISTIFLMMLIMGGNLDNLWQAGAAGVVLAVFGLLYHEIERYE